MLPPPPRSTLFPYTTLFRSQRARRHRSVHPARRWTRAGSVQRRGRDGPAAVVSAELRSEEHTSELQSLTNLVCRLLLEKKNSKKSSESSTASSAPIAQYIPP